MGGALIFTETGGWYYEPIPKSCKGISNVDYFSAGYYVGVIKKDKTAWVWGMHNIAGERNA